MLRSYTNLVEMPNKMVCVQRLTVSVCQMRPWRLWCPSHVPCVRAHAPHPAAAALPPPMPQWSRVSPIHFDISSKLTLLPMLLAGGWARC